MTDDELQITDYRLVMPLLQLNNRDASFKESLKSMPLKSNSKVALHGLGFAQTKSPLAIRHSPFATHHSPLKFAP